MALSRSLSCIQFNQGSQEHQFAPIRPATRKTNVDDYIPLCRAIQMGDWEKAQEFFNQDKHALTDKLNNLGHTALHLAIGNPENISFVEKLLEHITPESLPILVNNREQNALHHAAMLDNCKAAEKLVQKNLCLLFIGDCEKVLPIERALFNSHVTTFLYLLDECKKHIGFSDKDDKDEYRNPFEGENGVSVIGNAISGGLFDVAYDMLKEYPELARTSVPPNYKPLLWSIAKMWDAFPSAKKYNIYQRFVYSHVPGRNYGLDDTDQIQDIENQKSCKAELVTKSYVHPVTKKISARFWKFALLHVAHIKHLNEEKGKHNIALKILKFICEEVSKLKSNHFYHYSDAFIIAAKNNTPEVIEQIIRVFPESIWTNSYDGYTLPQLAVTNRCENVYNFLVHKVTHDKHLHKVILDGDRNNLLHLAGQLAPTDKLNRVTGAALQMQRELQWFQEVRKFIRPCELEAKNKEQETPIMVFRKEHKDLRKEGEAWMKKTADSYTITAALIITIVFAAAITVPGGNNGDTGKAIYKSRPSFIIFVVSDAISLFTSTTSLLLFLSILTARYAEEDFLYKLPKRLILGLLMLFLSVTIMLIAFSATLYIMFGQGKSWILIPIAAITCLPIASFVTLQLPLLVDLIYSTYGHRIFGK